MELPDKKVYEGYDLSKIRMLLYGLPKIGKSTFASKFNKTLFLATEKGLKGLDVFQINISNWLDFVQAVELLLGKKHDFHTVAIDTVDNLFKYCLDYVCTKHHIDHPSDSKWGKGWDLLQHEFEKWILKLSMSDMGLIFISHARESEVMNKHSKWTKIGPSIPNQARKVILPFVDIIGYCCVVEEQKGKDFVERRSIVFKPSDLIEAGDRTGFMPERINLRYESFKKYFEKTED